MADQSSKVDDTGAQRARTHRVAWMGAAAVLALAIFIVDSFTPFGIAIAVLYVVVLLLANQVASRNGLILIAAGCMALTVAGFLLDHGHEHIDEAAFRALISLAAIAITAVLLLRGRKVVAALEESEARYRMFLNISSVSFWRLDVSQLNDIFATLRAAGVTDLRQHADDNPQFVLKAMEVTTVADVNDKCIEMFGGKTRDDLIGRPVRDFWPEGKYDVLSLAVRFLLLVCSASSVQVCEFGFMCLASCGLQRSMPIWVCGAVYASRYGRRLV